MTSEAAGDGPPPSEVAIRSAIFRRYWIASTVSGAGSYVTTVAIPLLAIYSLHSGAFAVASLAAASQAGWLLLSLMAGVVVRRFPLRRLQVVLDVLRAAAMLSIPIAAVTGILSYWQLFVVAAIVGLATVIFSVANTTFVPALFPREELMARNSLLSGTDAVVQTAGPTIAGVLVQFAGPPLAIVIDGVSYIISAIFMSTLPERAPSSKSQSSVIRQIREGISFVIHHPIMFPCVLYATLINFVESGVNAIAPVFLVRTIGAPALFVGVAFAAQGVGLLVGATFATRLAKRFGSARALLFAAVVSAVFILLLPLTSGLETLILFGLGNVGFAIGMAVGGIATRTHRQTDTPAELMSRVMATVRFISWGAIPVGALVSGALAGPFGPLGSLAVFCVLPTIGLLALLFSPVGRRRDLEGSLPRPS